MEESIVEASVRRHNNMRHCILNVINMHTYINNERIRTYIRCAYVSFEIVMKGNKASMTNKDF